jgi:hypothetical protein
MSLNRNGLSDPFKSNNKSNQETKLFFKDILPNSKIVESNDSILTRFVKKFLNPTPINENLRVKFNLNNDYKMIYCMDKERMNLLLFSLINMFFPIFFLLVGVFVYAELTGKSQFSKSFEQPYEFLSVLTAYALFLYFISRNFQKKCVFRIYYNEKLDKYALFKVNGLVKFRMEEFTAKEVSYRFLANDAAKKNVLIQNLTKSQGNVYINNKLRNIEFNLFSSNSLEKFIGTKAYNLIKLESKSFNRK